jgi:hypothetical protein
MPEPVEVVGAREGRLRVEELGRLQLREAAAAGRLRTVPGIGEALESRIADEASRALQSSPSTPLAVPAT